VNTFASSSHQTRLLKQQQLIRHVLGIKRFRGHADDQCCQISRLTDMKNLMINPIFQFLRSWSDPKHTRNAGLSLILKLIAVKMYEITKFGNTTEDPVLRKTRKNIRMKFTRPREKCTHLQALFT